MASIASRFPSSSALIAFTLALPAGLCGQQPPESGGGPTDPLLVTLDFPGGTLSSYVDLLREKFDVNAVVAPDASEFPMPPLSLKRVSVGTAMNLIEAMSRSLSGDAGAVSVNTLSDPEGNPVFIVDLKGSGQPGPPPGVMLPGAPRAIPQRMMRGAGSLQLAAPGPQPARTLQVFSIKVITQPTPGRDDLAMPPENVLTAIDTALGLSPGEEPAQVKFHPETGLLFVHGSPGQIEAVGTLIRTLNEDQVALRKMAPMPTNEIQKLLEENNALRAQIAALSAEVQELKSLMPQAPPRGSNAIPARTPRTEPSRP